MSTVLRAAHIYYVYFDEYSNRSPYGKIHREFAVAADSEEEAKFKMTNWLLERERSPVERSMSTRLPSKRRQVIY